MPTKQQSDKGTLINTVGLLFTAIVANANGAKSILKSYLQKICFFDGNKQSILFLFFVYLSKKKKDFEHIKTNSKFCDLSLGFVDSGLGVRFDEQVEKLSYEIQL